MKPADYKTLIIKSYKKITGADYWNISDEDFKIFCDIAIYCKQGKLVLENWELYLGSNDDKTVSGFQEWCLEEFLKKDIQDNPFKEIKKLWEE